MAFKAARTLFRDFVRLPSKVKSYILQEQEKLRNAFRFDRNGVDYIFDGGQNIVRLGARTQYETAGHHQQFHLHRYIKTLSRLILPGNRFCHLFGKSWMNRTKCASTLFGAISLSYYGSSSASQHYKLSLDDIVFCMNLINHHEMTDIGENSTIEIPDSLREFKVKERLGEPSSSAAVYAAEYQNNEYAIKVMFNYEYASNEYAIRKGFSRECRVLSKEKHTFDPLGSSTQVRLPSHPNIIKILCAMVEVTPWLDDALQSYPSALPRKIYPDGFGRNKTMCLVMPKYDYTLHKYLMDQKPSDEDKILIMAQLLEGVAHLVGNYEAHRDLKADNILLKADKNGCPRLVITDFGCCLADKNLELKLPFESDHIDRGGNSALMAPEIVSASPSLGGFLDYTKADVWACGAIMLEIFGFCNPFVRGFLESRTYKDEDLLLFCKDDAPMNRVALALLRRDPSQRPTADEAAAMPILIQYAPKSWMVCSSLVSEVDINAWLMMMWLKLFRDERACLIRNQPFPTDVEVRRCFLERARVATILSALTFLDACMSQ